MFCLSSFSELIDSLLPQLLRLLPAKVLHPGECEKLCVLQELYGPEDGSALSHSYGISVYVWRHAGRLLWRCTD